MLKQISTTGIVLLGCLSFQAHAKTIYEAQNGDTINATIAANELTRIEIAGQKIIKDFSSADISKKITLPLGQVYLIPNTKVAFNLYIVGETGNTYNLKLTPSKNISGDSIVIKPLQANATHIARPVKSSSYERNINYLLEIMLLNKDDDSQYTTNELNQAIVTYRGLDSVLLKKYSNDSLTGYVLLLKNTSKTKILLSEGKFYFNNALAVAIESPELLSNEFTRVFIVMGGV